MPRAAWINAVNDEHASSELADVYAACADPESGRLANIMRVHCLHPQSMLDHRALYHTLMFGSSPLKRYQREMIGTVVSALNHCHY